jgi:hypothetical protein
MFIRNILIALQYINESMNHVSEEHTDCSTIYQWINESYLRGTYGLLYNISYESPRGCTLYSFTSFCPSETGSSIHSPPFVLQKLGRLLSFRNWVVCCPSETGSSVVLQKLGRLFIHLLLSFRNWVVYSFTSFCPSETGSSVVLQKLGRLLSFRNWVVYSFTSFCPSETGSSIHLPPFVLQKLGSLLSFRNWVVYCLRCSTISALNDAHPLCQSQQA